MSPSPRHSLLRPLGLSLALLSGCAPATLPSEDTAALSTREAEVRIANSLTTQALVLNAISTNPQANALVATSALQPVFDPATGDAYLREQLRDVDAQHFMEYVVGCALEAGSGVDWLDPLTNTRQRWEGLIGLCPEWASEVPSEACLHRVSSCVVARNNAFGRRVELSMRGEDPRDPSKFALDKKTRPTEYDPRTSAHVASFEACEEGETGASRDCGWTPDWLGRCTPGQTVRLGAGGLAPDTCTGAPLGATLSGRVVLRVCEGIAGCDAQDERDLAQSEGSCHGEPPAVAFTCPASGNFNVMLAPWDSAVGDGGASAQVDVETNTCANTLYRLSEAQAFRYREGAFYGTLFDADALAVTVQVTKGVVEGKGQRVTGAVYQKMYSCYDPAWLRGAAYALNRVCALPNSGENCAATVTGACVDRDKPSNSMCKQEDGTLVRLGDRDYEYCSDGRDTVWEEPVTTFLNAACDLAPLTQLDLCLRGPERL